RREPARAPRARIRHGAGGTTGLRHHHAGDGRLGRLDGVGGGHRRCRDVMPLARICALEHAHRYVGTREDPLGSNRGPLTDQWNMAANGVLGEPWCMSFMHAMFKECGVTLGGWAGVQNFLDWAQIHGYEVTRPFRGDLVCFDWNGDRWYDHVGIIDRVLAV